MIHKTKIYFYVLNKQQLHISQKQNTIKSLVIIKIKKYLVFLQELSECEVFKIIYNFEFNSRIIVQIIDEFKNNYITLIFVLFLKVAVDVPVSLSVYLYIVMLVGSSVLVSMVSTDDVLEIVKLELAIKKKC